MPQYLLHGLYHLDQLLDIGIIALTSFRPCPLLISLKLLDVPVLIQSNDILADALLLLQVEAHFVDLHQMRGESRLSDKTVLNQQRTRLRVLSVPGIGLPRVEYFAYS